LDTGMNRKHTPRPKISKVVELGRFKPYVFPPDFCLVIDTREQRPLFTAHPPKGLIMVRDTLAHGDYSIRGLENKVAVERKGITDLISYMTTERKRTKAKLEAMGPMMFKALVVESYWDDLFLPKFHSSVPPEVIRQSLVSFEVKFGLSLFVHPVREEIERWILDRLVYFFKLIRGV
jgi:DNA excision repair protein ERCC-4